MSSARPVQPQNSAGPPWNPRGRWIGAEVMPALEAAGTNAHRLFSSSEAWLERFGADLLLSYKSDLARDGVLVELPARLASFGFEPRRVFGKLLPRQNKDRTAPVLLSGAEDLPLETTVQEAGMLFRMDFAAGYSAGLFIDQRANRAFVRRAEIKRLLNTFAYTCSFSVAAALGGAATTSIDLSKKSLARGRENFALNGLELIPEMHRFYADDVLDALPRLERKGELFDAIVLDPPTFSRGNDGRKWQVEQDFEALLCAALALAAPGAKVLLSTNCTRLDRMALERIARRGLKQTRRAANFHREPALPDFPPEGAAQTLWLFLK